MTIFGNLDTRGQHPESSEHVSLTVHRSFFECGTKMGKDDAPYLRCG